MTRCRRCDLIAPQWPDLSPAARRVAALLELRSDDIDVPATRADADQLRDYLAHLPHTAAPRSIRLRRARDYLRIDERRALAV